MAVPFTNANFQRYLHDLHTKEKILTKELESVQHQIRQADEVLSAFGQWSETASPEAPHDQGRHSHIGPDDIAHCPTQHAALQEIARLSGGLANATSAADVLLGAGMTQAKKRSLVSTLGNFLSDEDVWEWVEPGVYRLRNFDPPSDEFEPDASNQEARPCSGRSLYVEDFVDDEQSPADSTHTL